MLYEKIDYTQAAAVGSSHHEVELSSSVPTPPPRSQDNMSMKECQAYGASTMCIATKNTTAPPQQWGNIEMKECKAYDVVASK